MISFFKRIGRRKQAAKDKEQLLVESPAQKRPKTLETPKTQIWNDLIDPSENTSADITQCLKDWNRDREQIFIHGISLEQIFIGKKYTKINEKGEIVARDVTVEELQGIWKEYLLKGIQDEKKEAMSDNLTKYMHQGGYLHMLQTSLFKIGSRLGVIVGGSHSKDVVPGFDIVVHGNEIVMRETLTVKALRSSSLDDPDADSDPEKPIAEGDPLMVLESVYKLSSDSTGKIQCTAERVTLEHHSDYTERLFEAAQFVGNFVQYLEADKKSKEKGGITLDDRDQRKLIAVMHKYLNENPGAKLEDITSAKLATMVKGVIDSPDRVGVKTGDEQKEIVRKEKNKADSLSILFLQERKKQQVKSSGKEPKPEPESPGPKP